MAPNNPSGSAISDTNRNLDRNLSRFDGMIGSGIFSVPGFVVVELNNSVGLTILLFVMGAIVSLFGVLAYCELGTMRPVSGGEKEYLDFAFPNAKKLFAFLFTQSMVWIIRPGACAADAISFGQFSIYSFTGTLFQLQIRGIFSCSKSSF